MTPQIIQKCQKLLQEPVYGVVVRDGLRVTCDEIERRNNWKLFLFIYFWLVHVHAAAIFLRGTFECLLCGAGLRKRWNSWAVAADSVDDGKYSRKKRVRCSHISIVSVGGSALCRLYVCVCVCSWRHSGETWHLRIFSVICSKVVLLSQNTPPSR